LTGVSLEKRARDWSDRMDRRRAFDRMNRMIRMKNRDYWSIEDGWHGQLAAGAKGEQGWHGQLAAHGGGSVRLGTARQAARGTQHPPWHRAHASGSGTPSNAHLLQSGGERGGLDAESDCGAVLAADLPAALLHGADDYVPFFNPGPSDPQSSHSSVISVALW
jgi:hypothetical protein